MAYPKPLRLQLGLSLAAFADLLNTNVGQLSMAESGLRSLPTASSAIAAALQKALTATTVAMPATNKPNKTIAALLAKHIRRCKVKMETLEIAALKLSEKLEAARRMLSLTGSFTALLPVADVSDVKLQMTILQRKAGKKVEVNEEKLICLQLSTAGLQAEIAKAKELTTY